MDLTPLSIEGAWLAESPVHKDDRGIFREWFKREEIERKTKFNFSPAQANISISNKGVIRGIHYSIAPEGQAKWITCVNGSILDVVVDIRPNSATYKRIEYVHLNGDDERSLLISHGLGHGFLSLEENSTVAYLLSSQYSPENELEVVPTDKDLNIDWHLQLVGGSGLILSTKDAQAPTLKEREQNNQLPRL
jgi:dTDP-4-dehydrorhamnose 3,5-epimerase